MAKKFKLKRPIQNIAKDAEVTEVTMKDDKDICAADFYGISPTGNIGAMADTVANMFNLTNEQVASLHPSDYIKLSGELAGFLE